MSARRLRWLPALLLVTACIQGNTEERSLVLSLSPLHYSEAEPFVSGSRALQGSRACFEVAWIDYGEGWGHLSPIEACYAITLDGAPFGDGECIELDQLTEHLVEYTPLEDCPLEVARDPIVSDRFRLQVVPVDGLRARLEWYLELWALRWLEPRPGGSFPADLIPPPDEPLRLVPGVEVAFPIDVIDARGERVAWDSERGRLLETRADGAPRQLTPLDDSDTLFPLSIGPGERTSLSLELAGAVLPVAEVIATPTEAAASLEIVMSHSSGAPRAARAMVRDAEDRVILGAPVEWTLVEGRLALAPIDDLSRRPIPEYTVVADVCVPPPSAPEPRRAIVRAQLGELVDEVELEWTAMPEEEPSEDPFEPSTACQRAGPDDDGLGDRGCGCTQAAGHPTDRSRGGLWLAVLGAAALRRRRRRSSGAPRLADPLLPSRGR